MPDRERKLTREQAIKAGVGAVAAIGLALATGSVIWYFARRDEDEGEVAVTQFEPLATREISESIPEHHRQMDRAMIVSMITQEANNQGVPPEWPIAMAWELSRIQQVEWKDGFPSTWEPSGDSHGTLQVSKFYHPKDFSTEKNPETDLEDNIRLGMALMGECWRKSGGDARQGLGCYFGEKPTTEQFYNEVKRLVDKRLLEGNEPFGLPIPLIPEEFEYPKLVNNPNPHILYIAWREDAIDSEGLANPPVFAPIAGEVVDVKTREDVAADPELESSRVVIQTLQRDYKVGLLHLDPYVQVGDRVEWGQLVGGMDNVGSPIPASDGSPRPGLGYWIQSLGNPIYFMDPMESILR